MNTGLYLFGYNPEFHAGLGRQFGVLTDDVEAIAQKAVVMHFVGYKRVSYAILGVDFSGRRVH